MGLKQTAVNIVCGFIPGRRMRHRVRTRLNYDIQKYIDFARRHARRGGARGGPEDGAGGSGKIIVVLVNINL